MLKQILKLAAASALILAAIGCSQDVGVSYTVEEVVEVQGDIVVQQREAYNQALDILFIIDESGSMSDEADILAATMPDMFAELSGPSFQNLEWRVGIKSTDKNDGGVYGWIDWDDPNPEFGMAALTLLGGNHWGEAGLDSMITSMLNDKDFHRDEAYLLGVFISDEEDQSEVSVADYKHLSSIYKAEPFEVIESAIINTNDNEDRCNSGYGTDIGTRYKQVSEIVVDICDTHKWIDVLDYAKSYVPTLNKIWPLEHVPLEIESIEVFVNDEEYHDWHYDDQENAVYMDVLPEVGDLVTIVYLID